MDLKKSIGFGVAGNFAGHLVQAGEASDFVNVKVKDENAPKGMFPFFLPGSPGHALGGFPVSHDSIRLPPGGGNVQIEPEVAVLCDLSYTDGKVTAVTPRFFAAYNDCSIRKPGAKKISEKKNWGACTKGLSARHIPVDRFTRGGVMDRYRIACYLLRGGELHTYGVDSPVLGYSYFYETLVRWMLEKLNTQQDEGPLECLPELLRTAGHPATAIISVGATKYTAFGEKHFLEPGDEAIVAVYAGTRYDAAALEKHLRSGAPDTEGMSILRQKVTGG